MTCKIIRFKFNRENGPVCAKMNELWMTGELKIKEALIIHQIWNELVLRPVRKTW